MVHYIPSVLHAFYNFTLVQGKPFWPLRIASSHFGFATEKRINRIRPIQSLKEGHVCTLTRLNVLPLILTQKPIVGTTESNNKLIDRHLIA